MKEPVKIRTRKLPNGVESIYLDINYNGKRQRESLKLYLNPGKDPYTKAKNKNAMEAAKIIQSRKIIELQQTSAGVAPNKQSKITLSEYINMYISSRNLAESYKVTLLALARKWTAYIGDTPMVDIDKEMLVGFPVWLQGQESSQYKTRQDIMPSVRKMLKQGKSHREIAKQMGVSRSVIDRLAKNVSKPPKICDNSADLWLSRMGTFMNRAEKDGIIQHNPYRQIDTMERPRVTKSSREFLTIEEIRSLMNTPCRESTKQAFMFSCFTGLRLSDIISLRWDNIRDNTIVKRMVKTNEVVRIPLSANALMFLPEKSSGKVFDIMDNASLGKDIQRWAKDAGIDKHISFHCARHTFATLLLTSNVDIYTVSKLLGHKNLATTQIYANIVDKKREDAVNAIPEI